VFRSGSSAAFSVSMRAAGKARFGGVFRVDARRWQGARTPHTHVVFEVSATPPAAMQRRGE
jgi:hypothetical protein